MATTTATNGAPPRSPVVCVFCGASSGKSPEHIAAARSLAEIFHANGIKLVYGGGNVGIMGEVAKRLVELSGPASVHGIIPSALLDFERGHGQGKISGVPDEEIFGKTTVVKDMHERKRTMAQEVIDGGPGSGFVVLSGGFGTLEEAMENATWNQLGIHDKPIVLYNVAGYWDGITQWVNTAVTAGFINVANAGILVEAKSAEEVLKQLQNYKVSEGRYKLNWEKA